MWSWLILFISLFLCDGTQGARILAIYPTPSVSHQVVFRALTLELAKQGHDVVTITTDPMFTKENITTPGKITEIDTSHIYKFLKAIERRGLERGVIVNIAKINTHDFKAIPFFLDTALSTPAVKDLLNDPNQKFDLIIVEALYYSPLILGKIYNAPVIWFSSFYGNDFNYEDLGAPTRHPLLYPNFYRYKFLNLSVWEKIYETYMDVKIWYTFSQVSEFDLSLAKKHFNIDTTLDELREQIDLLFINVNPIFENNRPVPQNIVYLGGLHMKPVKELSEDLKTFLDSSKNGVIYASFGTNVYTSLFDPELIEALLGAFEALPYDVLWKLDSDNLPRVPKNVRVQKWFPQRDLLGHPKIKAFVTQGGLQSLDETIDSEVPVVGIPFLADQTFNLEHCVRLGIGVRLDAFTFTAEDLIKGINTVIDDKSYKQNLHELKKRYYDTPDKSIDRAMWWVEYVLRHRGAKHLRSPAFQVGWMEYLMVDVILVVLTIVVAIASVTFAVIKKVFSFFSPKDRKLKRS